MPERIRNSAVDVFATNKSPNTSRNILDQAIKHLGDNTELYINDQQTWRMRREEIFDIIRTDDSGVEIERKKIGDAVHLEFLSQTSQTYLPYGEDNPENQWSTALTVLRKDQTPEDRFRSNFVYSSVVQEQVKIQLKDLFVGNNFVTAPPHEIGQSWLKLIESLTEV